MNYLNIYIKFCHKLSTLKVPKFRFHSINERYKKICMNQYNINYEDINKSNFIFLLISFTLSLLFLLRITKFNILLTLGISAIISLTVTYKFNSIIYQRIKTQEKQLNAATYLIRLYFSLIQNSLSTKSDFTIHFINMIKDYELTISQNFKNILNLIQLGEKPEKLLSDLILPSKDMNLYLNQLLTLDFKPNILINDYTQKTLEKKFNVFLKQIDSKLSIIFFISLFLPLMLSILILFYNIFFINLFPILLGYYFLLRSLNQRFLKQDFYLIGLLNDYSKEEKEKFNQFLSFLTNFALNLSKNLSPELAFISSYSDFKSKHTMLRIDFDENVSRLLNLSITLEELFHNLNYELDSPRYKLILKVLLKLLTLDSFFSNKKIFEILKIISKHQKLERKFETILKGEKFKVLIYNFLLPVIVGGVGGLFPIFSQIQENILNNIDGFNLILNIDSLIIFIALIISVMISSNLFANILNYKRKAFLILISTSVYICSFFWSLITILNVW